MLRGLTPPYSSTGSSSLVPSPPWHYAGQILSIGFETAVDAAGQFLTDAIGRATGRAFGHFCEWQATTDGTELLDPIYAQYKEFFVLIEVEANDGSRFLSCPFIFVDQDISLVRGLLQGWPKKLGSIWMTRSYDLDHAAAARIRKGTGFGASLSVKDRRLAEAQVTLTGEQTKPIGFLAMPTLGLVSAPTIVGSIGSGTHTLVRATVPHTLSGPVYEADATMRFFESPRDELSLLQPRSIFGATLSTFGLTITGASPVKELT